LSQWLTPQLRLQVSDCSTFLTMCDVSSTAVFCREACALRHSRRERRKCVVCFLARECC
jgi:hypothetical protein